MESNPRNTRYVFGKTKQTGMFYIGRSSGTPGESLEFWWFTDDDSGRATTDMFAGHITLSPARATATRYCLSAGIDPVLVGRMLAREIGEMWKT